MSLLYLFRHGQAGTREDYDRLSKVGEEQARRLAAHFASEKLRFGLFLTGPLRRQQQTAMYVHEAIGGPAPEVEIGWAEFDLDAVTSEIAPLLAADDAEFARAHRGLLATIASGDDSIHRRWTTADTEIVRAWVEGRYAIRTESWAQFCARIAGTRERLAAYGDNARIAISTSATPMAIYMSLALDLKPGALLRLAGHTCNAAYSVFRLRGGEVDVMGFNATSHLPAELRTQR